VVEAIKPGDPNGRVEFNGTLWSAESAETIPAGTPVEIIKRENLTLVVRSIAS